MPERTTDYKALPPSPKRLAKAAADNGWLWYADRAVGELESIEIRSLVVCATIRNRRIAARWETIGEDTELAVCWDYRRGEYPERIGLNEAIAQIKANPQTVGGTL